MERKLRDRFVYLKIAHCPDYSQNASAFTYYEYSILNIDDFACKKYFVSAIATGLVKVCILNKTTPILQHRNLLCRR